MSQYRQLLEHYIANPDWVLWAEAIIAVESRGNPYAVGDGSLALGVMQQHPDFQETYHPSGLGGSTWLRANTEYQIECLIDFWVRHVGCDIRGRMLIYHYGHLELEDPDNYWKKIQAAKPTS